MPTLRISYVICPPYVPLEVFNAAEGEWGGGGGMITLFSPFAYRLMRVVLVGYRIPCDPLEAKSRRNCKCRDLMSTFAG